MLHALAVNRGYSRRSHLPSSRPERSRELGSSCQIPDLEWYGRTIHLGTEKAISGEYSCDDPDYRYREASADDYLQDEFRIAPVNFGLEEAEKFGVTEVFCDGDSWAAPGGLLI